MTKIGGQCKGCSRTYWEGLCQAKTPGSESSIAAENDLPKSTSRADEGTIYNDPERALMNAFDRLTEIQAELSSSDISTSEAVTGTASHVVRERHVDSHVSHDALCQEQQMLSARVNAIYRCIGLLESHQKVLEAGLHGYGWERLERMREAIRGSYFRNLPYYQILLKCKYKLPGIGDLLRFMDEIFSDEVSSLVTIYELCSDIKSNHVRHEFRMSDPTQLLSHWDILHNSSTPDGHATRSVVLVDGLDSITIEIFGNALKLHPLVFVRHLWRNLGRDTLDREGGGPPLSQDPLCSLADKHSPRIALDIEEGMSLRSLDGTSLNGLEDLRSIETLGELHSRQEGGTPSRFRTEEDSRTIRAHLDRMRSQLGLPISYGEWPPTETARLETTILTRAIDFDGYEFFATELSKLELCVTATICTINQESQQQRTRTLVLRSPSRWHESPEGTARGTRYPPFSHDPFETEGLSARKDAESRGSVLEALCTVAGLDAAAASRLNQTEVSTLVSLSLLKASVSNVRDIAVADHLMLVDPGQSFLHENRELVEVSDGCSAYLVHRCQRQRDALLLASAVAEKLYSAAAESASSAFIDHVTQELGRIKAITTKTETQLQRTEKVLTGRIDQSFRDLQITLAKTQLEESRKAIKQADTVARLTILAFVFIPISAVCGFFGMNIIEVAHDGGFSFWVFGTTMGTVLAMTLLLAFADNIYAMWNYYAAKIDINMYLHTSIGYPPMLLTHKIPYLFRWINRKVKSIVATGQNIRIESKEKTEQEIARRGHV